MFQADGEQASTFLYPSNEDEETIDRYIGDATSGRIYPIDISHQIRKSG